MTTKPPPSRRPLRASDFAVRVAGAVARMPDGRPAAGLGEEDAWGHFRKECGVRTRPVELVRGGVVVARGGPEGS